MRPRIFYGWYMVAASAAIMVLSASTIYFGTGVLFSAIVAEFHWSTLAAAAAISLRSELSAIAAPLVGYLIDRFGTRPVMLIGLGFVAAGLLWLSVIDALWGFYGSLALTAIGTSGSGGSVGTIAVSRWFVRKRSRALSLMFIGPATAGITVPVLTWLITSQGWRTANVIWAGVIVVVCMPLALVIRDAPEKYGLRPDGDPPDQSEASSDTSARPRVQASVLGGNRSLTVKEALRTRTFWQLMLAYTLTNLANTPAVVLAVPFLVGQGIPTETAAWAAAGIPAVSVIGRVGLGFWGDFYDKRYIVAFSFALQAAGIFLLAGITEAWMILPFLLLFAVGFGGPIPLRSALQADYFGLGALGSIQGALMFMTTIGGFLGPIFLGALVDMTGQYQLGWVLLAAVCALGVPLTLMMPRPLAPGRRAAVRQTEA